MLDPDETSNLKAIARVRASANCMERHIFPPAIAEFVRVA
jgi:hypothetical protein